MNLAVVIIMMTFLMFAAILMCLFFILVWGGSQGVDGVKDVTHDPNKGLTGEQIRAIGDAASNTLDSMAELERQKNNRQLDDGRQRSNSKYIEMKNVETVKNRGSPSKDNISK